MGDESGSTVCAKSKRRAAKPQALVARLSRFAEVSGVYPIKRGTALDYSPMNVYLIWVVNDYYVVNIWDWVQKLNPRSISIWPSFLISLIQLLKI